MRTARLHRRGYSGKDRHSINSPIGVTALGETTSSGSNRTRALYSTDPGSFFQPRLFSFPAATVRRMSAEDITESTQENTEARHEREWPAREREQVQKTLHYVTASIGRTKADLQN